MKTLEEKTEAALKWALEAAESERARVGNNPDADTFVPSWLPELENALREVEAHEQTEEEYVQALGAHEAMKEHIADRRRRASL